MSLLDADPRSEAGSDEGRQVRQRPQPPAPGPAPGAAATKSLRDLTKPLSDEERRPTPIVPPGNVAGRTLMFVIAIMTFLACLTQGTSSLVRSSASLWTAQVSREATIQIKPTAVSDMQTALETARAFALSIDGVADARIIDAAGAAALLEPWLGSDLSLEELPVPRLVELTVDVDNLPDFGMLREGLALAVPGASLDDHRTWVDRLIAMAKLTTVVGTVLLALVIGATAMTVIFATRGAMAGNRHVIEVLHFVGAEARFVAAEFEHHFLKVGAKGAAAGCLAAVLVFAVAGLVFVAAPEGAVVAQSETMFGSFRLGWGGYAGMVVIAGLIAIVTSLTTGATVRRTLREVDEARGAGENRA